MNSDLPDKIVARRNLVYDKSTLREADIDGNVRRRFVGRADRAGIAFSGGGIRSATISLGLTEALAAYGRFYAFDMMSTVSGGGYFGSFLRSLFVEREEDKGEAENRAVVTDRLGLADKVLRSLPDQQYFRGEPGRSDDVVAPGITIKNPLWWLRENGRYLAPNGMSDYAFALAFFARNWAGLILAFLLPMMLAFATIQLAMIGIFFFAKSQGCGEIVRHFVVPQYAPLVSPAFSLLPGLIALAAGVAAGYWISIRADENPETQRQAKWQLYAHWGGVTLFFVLLAVLMVHPDYPNDGFAVQSRLFAGLFGGAMLVSSWLVIFTSSKATGSGSMLREYRRRQTRLFVFASGFWLYIAIFAFIDSLAILARDYTNDEGSGSLAVPASLTAILAWLSAKVPQWLDAKNGGISRFLKSYGNAAAMVGAMLMLAALALLADMLMLKLIWSGETWNPQLRLKWHIIVPVLSLIFILMLVVRGSSRFLNVIGLSQLYASRLSRSYLGATNYNRLQTGSTIEITQSTLGDDLSLTHYMNADVAAPLHLINVTLNRTIGHHSTHPAVSLEDDPLIDSEGVYHKGRLPSYESALALRDRQGDRLVFGPYGIRTGGEFFSWKQLEAAGAEKLTVGTICSISGAAVNSGMGRHTTLGRSILLTLANLRLGHWWKSPLPENGIWNYFAQTYDYFLSEMLARFKRQKGYWHLSDGGHSENTGALSLLERGCNFILVSDNGEDPDYQFSDLEIFVRTARTDIGAEIEVVSDRAFPTHLNLEKKHFFNGTAEDWRKKAKDKDSNAFALLLAATRIPSTDVSDTPYVKPEPGWIIWLKPSLFRELPSDIATYAELHPDFPQQPTSNQFFDEAQWESYRRLGFAMGRTLFQNKKALDKLLPIIRLKI